VVRPYRCSAEQIATIDAHNDWLRASVARCKTFEERKALDDKARALQAHRLVPVLHAPQCAECGWCMVWTRVTPTLEVWAWDYTRPKVLCNIDASATELCPDCDSG